MEKRLLTVISGVLVYAVILWLMSNAGLDPTMLMLWFILGEVCWCGTYLRQKLGSD